MCYQTITLKWFLLDFGLEKFWGILAVETKDWVGGHHRSKCWCTSEDQTAFTKDIWFSIDRRPEGWHGKRASQLQAITPGKFVWVFTANLSIQQLSDLMFEKEFYKCASNSVWTYNWLQGICCPQREEWSLLTTAVSHTRGALMGLGSWSGILVAPILTRRRWDYPTALESLPSCWKLEQSHVVILKGRLTVAGRYINPTAGKLKEMLP